MKIAEFQSEMYEYFDWNFPWNGRSFFEIQSLSLSGMSTLKTIIASWFPR